MSTPLQPYQIMILNAELSYPKLFEAVPFKDSKPRFGATFILREGTHDSLIKEIKDRIAALMAEKRKKIKPANWCFQEADPDEYGPGAWAFVSYSKETDPPQVLRRDKTTAVPKDNLFYGGAIVNGIVHIYESFDKINGGLDAVMFVRDGERKGRKPIDAAAALPSLDDDDDGMN